MNTVTRVVLLLALAHPSSAADDTFRITNPILVDAVFTAVNAERTGYLEAELFTTAYVRVENMDRQFPGSGLLRPGSVLHASFDTKVETIDGNGRKQKQKIVKVTRAGPGEQITFAFKHDSTGANVNITLIYYDENGSVVGRTPPYTVWVADTLQRTSTAVTFTRQDLRR